MNRTLARDRDHAILGGVCSGLAEYLNTNVTLVRLLFIFIFAFTSGAILLLYIFLWIVLPQKNQASANSNLSSAGDFADRVHQVAQEAADLVKQHRQSTVQLVGIGLVVLGVIIFLQTLDLAVFYWIRVTAWPSFLIILGIYLVIVAIKGREK